MENTFKVASTDSTKRSTLEYGAPTPEIKNGKAYLQFTKLDKSAKHLVIVEEFNESETYEVGTYGHYVKGLMAGRNADGFFAAQTKSEFLYALGLSKSAIALYANFRAEKTSTDEEKRAAAMKYKGLGLTELETQKVLGLPKGIGQKVYRETYSISFSTVLDGTKYTAKFSFDTKEEKEAFTCKSFEGLLELAENEEEGALDVLERLGGELTEEKVVSRLSASQLLGKRAKTNEEMVNENEE